MVIIRGVRLAGLRAGMWWWTDRGSAGVGAAHAYARQLNQARVCNWVGYPDVVSQNARMHRPVPLLLMLCHSEYGRAKCTAWK